MYIIVKDLFKGTLIKKIGEIGIHEFQNFNKKSIAISNYLYMTASFFVNQSNYF